jgi:dienelactone hydrolase
MAEVLVFHHAHGLTAGVLAFSDELRRAGHAVHVPDLYEGRTFDDLEAGVSYAQEVGFGEIIERGVQAADELAHDLVYAGFSLGVLPAQKLAQTRPGAVGALLFSACLPPSEFESTWPDAVPLQVHGMDADEFFAEEGDLDAARELVAGYDDRELFLYPGHRHLFADNSLSSYDQAAADFLTRRVLDFLNDLK